VLTSIRKILFEISTTEASFGARGFEACDPAVKVRLERIIQTFLEGYNLALKFEKPELLVAKLDAAYDAHHVGFAYEGTGLYYGMTDFLFSQKRSNIGQLVEGPPVTDFII
jgi:hypothetical protein